VSKHFEGVRALTDVALTLRSGEVRGVVGTNGSGKSTLVKILSGFHQPESGAIMVLRGEEESFAKVSSAQESLGIGVVHQDLGLIGELTALENFVLPSFAATVRWYIDWRSLRESAKPFLARFGITTLDAKVNALPRVSRALLALARAVRVLEASDRGRAQRHGVLMLDEITAFLSREEVQLLHEVVRDIASRGHAVLFISHDLDEVMAFADSVTVLRDGMVVGELSVAATSPDQLFELIVGRRREIWEDTPLITRPGPTTANRIRIEGAGVPDAGTSTFDVMPGEFVGLTGLLGSGFEEVPYVLYGARSAAVGRVYLNGQELSLSTLRPSDAMSKGIVLVPGDRLGDGLVGSLSVAENLAMPQLPRFVRAAILVWKELQSYVRDVIARFSIVSSSPDAGVLTLSGGNQQRVLLAKWLEMKSTLLLLHEPVRGVDVAARAEIIRLLRRHVSEGTAVICASSDYEFLSDTCDRVLVYRNGTIVEELKRPPDASAITKSRIEWSCLGSGITTVVIEPGLPGTEDA
jgi:ribose transport system ATP-binding protein